ncbi:MAG: glycosyltransferase [Chlamydiae bacterium]|nr:glycosyltransferase [Chlamydiota bacterium]MBI3266516.1 glycosyltransferase [Chlamydiota bacterium]
MKVSIIIPVKAINDYIRESIPHILDLDFQDFEILIFTDYLETVSFPKTKVISSGPVSPSYKRDMALEHAQGEILAFLDDDAYPKQDWITKALKHFEQREVASVCGPAVTPFSDPFWAKLSGAFYTSLLGSGMERFRYWPGRKIKEVEDYPSVNLWVRKNVFKEVGGFDTHYWPGEDTKLCLEIIKKGYKIVYDPKIFVWHHRRNSFKKHLLQISRYAVHRGFFAKKYPETSLKPAYFIPSLFTIYTFLYLAFSLFCVVRLSVSWYSSPVYVYFAFTLAASLIEAIRSKNVAVGLLLPFVFFLSHVTYGVGFLLGLLKKELKR